MGTHVGAPHATALPCRGRVAGGAPRGRREARERGRHASARLVVWLAAPVRAQRTPFAEQAARRDPAPSIAAQSARSADRHS